MIGLGLCCVFLNEDIKFRRMTATRAQSLNKKNRLEQLSERILHNAKSLISAIDFCSQNKIRAFRINSQILPLKTHEKLGFQLTDLPENQRIIEEFIKAKELAEKNKIRLSFHPDQFILLSSPRQSVIDNSITELIAQAELAEMIGADVINIHGGGSYGNKSQALAQLDYHLAKLPRIVKKRLTLENDDRIYTPLDLLPHCRKHKIPLVYDVHHHRCHPDSQSIEQTTTKALETWNRQPLFHISSPKEGWNSKNPRSHHDYIDINDFPEAWLPLELTIDVEAKAKELAVIKLREDLEKLLK